MFKTILPLKKTVLILFLSSFFWVGLDNKAKADTLQTANYRVTIVRNCPEGYVVCDRVTYTGKNLKTGQSIQLTGKTVHTLAADGVTPGRFLGYEFRSGNYRYFLTDEGTLQVYQGEKLVLEEQGSWQR